MLLDRIDIDAHGPLRGVELGPFAEHLNVICGPSGSGKTAIVRFLRDTLVDRDYPLGMLSSSTGRVVWADRQGRIHCRREQDGTRTGRRSVQFESRGNLAAGYDSLRHSWMDHSDRAANRHDLSQSIQLPESLVDGVITDTSVTSVARVVSACVRSGIGAAESYATMPLHQTSGADSKERRAARGRLAQIDAELSRFDPHLPTETQLHALRSQLQQQLQQLQNPPLEPVRVDLGRWEADLTRLHDQARRLGARQNELRRWIAEIDSDIARHNMPAAAAGQDYRYRAALSDDNLRRQLDDLDVQGIRWRRTLMEVRGLHHALLSGNSTHPAYSSLPELDEAALRQLRLDGFLYSIDHYERSRRWNDLYCGPYRPLQRFDDIDQRIESATRQIDWLLQHYANPDQPQQAWYESLAGVGSVYSTANGANANQANATLGDTLRAIREDLRRAQRSAARRDQQNVRRDSGRGASFSSSYPAAGQDDAAEKLEELRRSEEWLVAAIAHLDRHRQTLLRDHAATHDMEMSGSPCHPDHELVSLQRERDQRASELVHVTSTLESCLEEAAQLRRSMRSLPVVDSAAARWHQVRGHDVQGHDHDARRQSLMAELNQLDQQLVTAARVTWLQSQRDGVRQQLRSIHSQESEKSTLAAIASRWLIRLSAARLQRVQWAADPMTVDPETSYHGTLYGRTGVTINGRDEHQCSDADRSLAALAVRMAAGELLYAMGRPVPLVVETHAGWFGDANDRRGADDAPLAYSDHGDHGRSNDPIAAALADYTAGGRQLVVLTSDLELHHQLSRSGGRSFQLYVQRVVHPHRPLWRSQYHNEQYVGPHPHTYGPHDAVPAAGGRRSEPRLNVDVNRDFDTAWRETHGGDHGSGRAVAHTDWARDGVAHRDGYYYADSYTTQHPAAGNEQQRNGHRHDGVSRPTTAPATVPLRTSEAARVQPPASPFFLSVDSPIDQAPSIDAVAAARLRGLQVTHINHLMQQDSNRLADALGLADVEAATIRRWQSECRLVCRVPRLRGFDARILVGCGVTTPSQLAAIHPVDLLRKVESFLATQPGQQTLRSGSSHELSRLTSWIATANSGKHRQQSGDTRQSDHQSRRPTTVDTADRRPPQPQSARSQQRRQVSGPRPESPWRNADSPGRQRAAVNRQTRRHDDADSQDARDVVRYPHDMDDSDLESIQAETTNVTADDDQPLTFYLDRNRHVVDAPSIGPRMGERLGRFGLVSVDDLLNADPDSVARQLGHRRVDGDTVVRWQHQATLVCCVPGLRGHDAQFLVAAGVTSPAQLAESDPQELFDAVQEVAESNAGKRIARGSKLPDLAEVTQWIEWAQHHRQLRAA